MIDFVAIFIAFFTVIDPIGTVPVFVAVTNSLEGGSRARVAARAVAISAAVLVFFVAAGEPILKAIDVPLSAFQIAGGIVLFLFALTMIFGPGKPESELAMIEGKADPAVFPLAVPSIASPGAMLAAVLLTQNDLHGVAEQVQITCVMLTVLFVTWVLLRASGRIHRVVGDSGASVISRVMGLLLAAVAASNVLGGIKLYFDL
jgi:multiple antibiotic resistance protein